MFKISQTCAPTLRFFRRLMLSHPLLFTLVFVTVVDAILLRNTIGVGPFQASDNMITIYSWNQFDAQAYSAWNFAALGSPNGQNFLLLYEGVVVAGTNNPAAVQQLAYFSALPVSAVLAFFLFQALGIRKEFSVPLSITYALCPWLVGLFVEGQPGLVWVYALYPLLGSSLLIVGRSPRDWRGYAGLAGTVCLSSIATGQAAFVYLFLGLPFVLEAIDGKRLLESIRIVLGLAGSFAIGVATVASSFSPYLATASAYGVSGGSSSNVFTTFGFDSPTADAIGLWIMAFAGCTCLIVLWLYRLSSRLRAVSLGLALVGAAFSALYFLIPGSFASLLFSRVPIFWPFLDFDKFLLVTWTCLFLLFSISLEAVWEHIQASRDSNASGKQVRAETLLSMPRRLGAARGNALLIASLSVVALILAASILFVPVQNEPQPPIGIDFFSGETNFGSHEIPPAYFDLRSFLLQSGASFNLGFQTLLLPQNPGAYVPADVGEYVIPGFVPPSPALKPIAQAFTENNSDAVYMLALMGVKYLAIIPSPPSPWWPSLAAGPPSVGDMGVVTSHGEGWFPQGNASGFTRMLTGWPMLTTVLSTPNLTVLQDLAYTSPVYTFSSMSYALNLSLDNSSVDVNRAPVTSNQIKDPSLIPSKNWTIWTSQNASFLSNGSFVLGPGSTGANACQTITLMSGAWYELAYNLNQTALSYLSPPNEGFTTGAGVFWNPYTGANITGAFVSPPISSAVNEHFQYLFHTPSIGSDLRSHVVVSAGPAQGNSTNFVRFSNLSLIRLDGRSLFPTMIKPVTVSEENVGTYASSMTASDVDQYLTLDTSYDSHWEATTSTAKTLQPTAGPFGFVTFLVPPNQTIETVHYAGQTTYTIVLVGSFVAQLLVLAGSTWALVSWRLRLRGFRLCPVFSRVKAGSDLRMRSTSGQRKTPDVVGGPNVGKP